MTIEDASLSAHNHQLLPLATNHLVDENRNLMVSGIFHLFYSLLVEGRLLTIKDPSLSVHGYQLLPLATSHLVGDNRKLDVSGIF